MLSYLSLTAKQSGGQAVGQIQYTQTFEAETPNVVKLKPLANFSTLSQGPEVENCWEQNSGGRSISTWL